MENILQNILQKVFESTIKNAKNAFQCLNEVFFQSTESILTSYIRIEGFYKNQ